MSHHGDAQPFIESVSFCVHMLQIPYLFYVLRLQCVCVFICLRSEETKTPTNKKSKQIDKVSQWIYKIEKSFVSPKNELLLIILVHLFFSLSLFLTLCAVCFSLFPSYAVLVYRASTVRSRNRYVLLKDYTIEAVETAPAVYQRIRWTKSN